MKLPKLSTHLIAVILCTLIVIGSMAGVWRALTSSNPLAAYTTSRQCTFIELAALHAAACSDGTVWLISPLKP